MNTNTNIISNETWPLYNNNFFSFIGNSQFPIKIRCNIPFRFELSHWFFRFCVPFLYNLHLIAVHQSNFTCLIATNFHMIFFFTFVDQKLHHLYHSDRFHFVQFGNNRLYCIERLNWSGRDILIPTFYFCLIVFCLSLYSIRFVRKLRSNYFLRFISNSNRLPIIIW